MNQFKDSMLQLISETSSNLPPDVRRALKKAMENEKPKTQSALALQTIAINVDMACDNVVRILECRHS